MSMFLLLCQRVDTRSVHFWVRTIADWFRHFACSMGGGVHFPSVMAASGQYDRM